MFTVLPLSAEAVQWESLARTSRHNVAIDMSSVRLTTLSRLAVWLRFTPTGERERKQSATEYGQKAYRLHMEYYEIDCSEQNAVMGMLDVLGPALTRISRSKGNSTPDAIIPGSVLDMAMQRVCPSMEENATNDNDEIQTPDTPAEEDSTERNKLSSDALRSISDAGLKTEADPTSLEAWRELGNLYFDADMPAEAISAYNKALEINPNETNILNDQGAMYRQTGEFSRALANFEKARSVDPNNLESLYNSGYVLAFDLNQIDKALVLWRQYLVLDSSSEASRQVQSFVERYGKSDVKESKGL
jgi:tetratricopeptide (TPR) repeat protein